MINFNGKNLIDFGCHTDELDSLTRPQRDTSSVEIPGRNGTLTFSNNRFKNVTLSFNCMIDKDFERNYAALMAFLLQDDEYHRLEGYAEKETYRMAKLSSAPKTDTSAWFQRATFTLDFDCKPQRFLKSGKEVKTFTAAGTLKNPTLFTALPLIRAYGTGNFSVGGITVKITSADSYTDIDCDMQEAYKGTTNCNGNITLTDGEFPSLKEDVNEITMTGITKLEITPRWWTI